MKMPSLLCGLSLALAVAGIPAAVPTSSPPALAFRIDEGRNLNSFLRDGPVAAHLLLRSGTEPRILVAFPAGNSGVGLWFETTTHARGVDAGHAAAASHGGRRQEARPLHGIEFEVETDARELRPRAAVLSSVRVLRDYELQRTGASRSDGRGAAAAAAASPGREIGSMPPRVIGSRIEARGDGARCPRSDSSPRSGAPLRLRIQALTGEAPLAPLNSLLTTARRR